MQLEVIFSYDDRPQQIVLYPFHVKLIEDEKTFFEFVTSILKGEEREQLVKISTCVYFALGLPDGQWYKESNGKFYLDDIVRLLKDVWAIKSLVDIEKYKN